MVYGLFGFGFSVFFFGRFLGFVPAFFVEVDRNRRAGDWHVFVVFLATDHWGGYHDWDRSWGAWCFFGFRQLSAFSVGMGLFSRVW